MVRVKPNDEYLFAIGHTQFMGASSLPNTVGVFSPSCLKGEKGTWPSPAPLYPELADHLDSELEGFYRYGKQYTHYIGASRQSLCYELLGVELRDVWHSPQYFQHEPFFELLYCSDHHRHWLSAKTCYKLLQDVQSWANIITWLEDKHWEKIFAFGADNGFVCLIPDEDY